MVAAAPTRSMRFALPGERDRVPVGRKTGSNPFSVSGIAFTGPPSAEIRARLVPVLPNSGNTSFSTVKAIWVPSGDQEGADHE